MKNDRLTILFPLHTSLDFGCDVVRQMANEFKKRHTVIFFDYENPLSLRSLIFDGKIQDIFIAAHKIRKKKKVIYLPSFSILPFARFQRITQINKIASFFLVLLLLNRKVIIWQFFPLIASNFFRKYFGHIFVYDCIDYLDVDIYGKRTVEREKKLFAISDLVIFNSSHLMKIKRKENPKIIYKSIYTVCGCNYGLFNIQRDSIKSKVAIFYGYFDYRVNTHLLKKTIENNPDWKFIIIGSTKLSRRSVSGLFTSIIRLKNVEYVPELRKKKLVGYVKKACVGIIPYDTKYPFVRYSNPMKAYEYLAAGLSVISTNILALQAFSGSFFYTTDNAFLFSDALDSLYNRRTRKIVAKAKKIAYANSWRMRIKIIENKTKKYQFGSIIND